MCSKRLLFTQESQVFWSPGDRCLKTGRSFLTTGEIKGLIEILSLAVPSGKGKGGKEKRDRLEITKQEKKMKKMKRGWFILCQRDPCLLPIFLLCLIEDFDFAFYLSYDFVTLILRPVYFLHFHNKAMSNTHSYFSKIALQQSIVFVFEFPPGNIDWVAIFDRDRWGKSSKSWVPDKYQK